MKKTAIPFHTLFLSLYPVLYLYANNILYIGLHEPIRAMLVITGAALFFLIAFRAVLKSWGKAGLLVSIMISMFFSFGHITNMLKDSPFFQTSDIFSITTIAWIWLIVLLLLMLSVLRMRQVQNITFFLNVISLALMLFPIGAILYTTAALKIADGAEGTQQLAALVSDPQAAVPARQLALDAKPDIYYLILDGYERADKLQQYYGYDNSSFIEALEGSGFYVAHDSRSNYLNTTYSLNTAFNLQYFHAFPKLAQQNARYNLRTNYLTDFLRGQGYQIVVFESGTGDSTDQYADVLAAPAAQPDNRRPIINRFEALLLRTTAGVLLFEADSKSAVAESVNRELDLRRERISYAFTHLPDYAGAADPQFVFAHIYLPHMPFLYGPDGAPLGYHGNTNFYWYETPPENYIDQYIDQIEYLNTEVRRTIDRIIAGSNRPLVIILQSDHGDDKYLDWDEPSAQGVDVRSATLSAVYFSDKAYEDFYPSMSTVNTFRLVINHWFGTQFDRLADRIYFHGHPTAASPNTLPEFFDGCEYFQLCLPEPGAAAFLP